MKICVLVSRYFFAALLLLIYHTAAAQVPQLAPASMPVGELLSNRTPPSLVPDLTFVPVPNISTERYRPTPEARKAVLFQLALSPIWMQSGVAFHEGMHAIPCVIIEICTVVKYRPFPGYLDSPKYGRTFYFGYVDAEVDDGETFSKRQRLAITGGPLTGDMMLFMLGDVLLSRVVSKDSRIAPFVLSGMLLVPFVDFMHNTTRTHPLSDFARLSEISEWHLGTMATTSLVIAGFGAWRIVHHSKRIFFEKKPKTSE